MNFTETTVAGAYLIEVEPIEDERGFFARSFCRDTFASRGLVPELVQCSISFTRRKGTLRGLHYQGPPHEETKLVRCTRGAVFDVIVDLRSHSATFKNWTAHVLTAENRLAHYVPRGCAHGFQALEDDSELLYQMSAAHAEHAARAVRFDDPAFGIRWPLEVTVIADRDRTWPDFGETST